MKEVYIITPGSLNKGYPVKFAFHDYDEAQKLKEYLDRQNGASYPSATVTSLRVYDSANQFIGEPNE